MFGVKKIGEIASPYFVDGLEHNAKFAKHIRNISPECACKLDEVRHSWLLRDDRALLYVNHASERAMLCCYLHVMLQSWRNVDARIASVSVLVDPSLSYAQP